MEDDKYRMRAKRKLLQVTFPSGKRFCYTSATATMIETLKEIGADRFPEITLEMSKLRIVSQEVYPGFKDYIKPICDGWYLNTQSNTDTKYLQLRAISDALNLGLEIVLDSGLEPMEIPKKTKTTRSKEKLRVTFPDGVFITFDSSAQTLLECVKKMGVSEITRRDIIWSGSPLITITKENNRQVQLDANHWMKMPSTTKERAKLLRIIALHMRQDLKIIIY